MRKAGFYCFFICCLLTACIEMESSTTIHTDGSGILTTEMDMSQLVAFMQASKSEGKKETINYDTLIQLRLVTDTASQLTAREKELLRDASFRMKASTTESVMKFTFSCPFAKLEDVQEISTLLGSSIFDQYFDQALASTGLAGNGDEEKKSNSNLFGTVSPNYFDYKYQKGKLSCSINAERLATFRKNWDASAEAEDNDRQLLELISYVHRINLPSNAKKITGDKIKEDGSARSLVQKGDLLDLYEHPEAYVFSIKY